MKLLALIKPRKDGTINLTDSEGKAYLFKADESGDLVCDVDDEALVKRALATGNFAPADESDFDLAEKLVVQAVTEESGDGDHSDDDDDYDDGDDEGVNEAAMPVEAATPPKSFKPKRKAK